MKYDPKTEILVFQAVKELGEGTREEIHDYLSKHLNLELKSNELLRYLFKWKAKKIFTIRTRDGQEVWALADIPPWYASGIMATLTKSTNEEMKAEIQALDERIKEGSEILTKHSPWCNYKSYELTFEAIDPLLGGHPSNEDRETVFPRRNGKPYIPAAWFYGWFRDNQKLMESAAIHYNTAFGSGEFLEEPKLVKKTLKVKTGLNTYEAIPEGTKFKVVIRFPMRGSKIKSEEDLRRFLKLLEEAPIRGLSPF
jgi:gas vesicle protein